MADIDPYDIWRELRQKKVPFKKFIFGVEGGLDAKALERMRVSSLDMRYKVIPKGTKLYTMHSDDRMLVFSMNVDTLLSISEPNLEKWRGSEDLECLSVFEVSYDVTVMQIDEEVAQEVCLRWCLSRDKESADDEEGSVESSEDRLKFKSQITRSIRSSRNLMDWCLTDIYQGAEAVVYSRAESDYRVLVSTQNVQPRFLKKYQDFVVPQKAMERLGVDKENYLVLKPSGHTWRRGDDIDGGRSTNSLKESSSEGEPVPSFDDKFPNAQEYNDYREDQHSQDYEAIMILPRDSPTKTQAPRPDQPPPAPPSGEVAEPVYSTIDKSGKKQQQQQREEIGSQSGDATRPRPPPLETMPNTESASPAVVHVQAKPQRPSAPPKVQRKASESSLTLNSKEEVLTPPPRGTGLKGKLRLKSDSTKF